MSLELHPGKSHKVLCMDNFWNNCIEQFRGEITPQQYETWVKPLLCTVGDEGVILTAPNRFAAQWIKDKLLPHIQAAVHRYFGKPLVVHLKTATKPSTALRHSQEKIITAHRAPIESARLNPAFTFDSYVPGKANQLARAAALQIAEHPGTAYNPLFVYGGVGLGKTHLVQAIGNFVLRQNSGAKVRYVHSAQYVSDVVKAYQHKSFDDFKRYYHSLDMLLVDDIQFFIGKTRTQEEFFHAFNALVEAHKQVIITCDTYPKDIAGIENRLISRFGWGLTVAIEPPELEMRVAILLKKAEAEGTPIDENVAFFIARLIQSNVRELEGALKRVSAYARFSERPIDTALAKEALRDVLALQARQISIENIQKTVADYYKIKVSEMYSKKRSRAIVRPRQVAMALAKELTQLSLPDIGDAFGGKDHTTILHACRKVADLKETHPEISKDYLALLQILRG